MDMEALKAAVSGASTLTAPGQSPNQMGANAFTQSALGHIQDLAGSNYQLGASTAASGQLQGQLTSNVNEQQAQDEAARQAAIAKHKKDIQDAQDKIDAYADPKKYIQQINSKGGYDFFAPDGTPISAQDYAKVQNKHITDILKDSQDTTDQEFVQNYNEVRKIGEFVQGGDKAGYEKFLSKDPDLKKRMADNNINNYADLVKSFRSNYPQYFSTASAQDVGDASYNGTGLRDNRSTLDKLKSRIGLAPSYKGF